MDDTNSQEAALLAGSNITGKQMIEFDPAELTQSQREELAKSEMKDGIWQADACRDGRNYLRYYGKTISVADIDALRSVLDERIAEREKKAGEEKAKAEKLAAEIDAACQAFIAAPVEKRLYVSRSSPIKIFGITTSSFDFPYGCDREAEIAKRPGGQAALDEAKTGATRLNAEAERDHAEIVARNKATAEAKAKAEAEAADRKAAQIAAWVEAHGTENQKARHKDGLLPDNEIIDAIRSEAYTGLKGFPRYDKMKASDVCEGYDDYDGDTHYHDVDFDVETADTLTADQYDRLQEIKKAAPKDATVEARIHTGKCDECETEEARIGFMVRVKVGELDFSREYGWLGAE